MTYSIVAHDSSSSELGVAVQSRAFRSGGGVPWAQPGVGAVATQSVTRRAYGPLLLEQLEAGAEPARALRRLVADDPQAELRQVAVVDAHGRTASHTGAACIPAARAVDGSGFSAQGNMLASEEVVDALAEGFAATPGSLARRLLAGLDAAEDAGGDFRGREAAAIVVVSGDTATERWERVSDLRVDNHPEPLRELRRLLDLEEALRALRRLSLDDPQSEIDRAREAGVDDDVARWVAATTLLDHDPALAEEIAEPLTSRDPRWREAFARIAELR
jgi:uncharacterized Ntn-hydrolase superfamily protein